MRRTILIAALALAGCATGPGDAAARAGDDGALAYGGLNQTIRVGGLTVRPLAVTEDSRCPADVACVWAGRVVLRARVSGMAGEQAISSIAPLALPGGGRLELASVAPRRLSARPGTSAPYRFGFRRVP
jgi:hypothetical protein